MVSEQDAAVADSGPADDVDLFRVGPGALAGRFLRRFWHPVFRAEDLLPGWTKPLRILGEDFTLYRGEDGAAHAVAFRCAHRGTQLSVGWVEGDCIRCFYHGWKYDASGQCVEQPAEKESFADKVRIRSYPTEEYLGLVFAYLGEGDAPPLPRYPALEREGELEVTSYEWPSNYFYAIDNDPVHIAFVHRDSNLTKRGLVGVPEIWGEESAWGMTTFAKRSDSDIVRATQFGMPNVAYISVIPADPEVTDWPLNLAWRVPVDDENTVHFRLNHTAVTGEAAERYRERQGDRPASRGGGGRELGEAVLAGKLRIQDIEHPDIEYIQDYVSQVGQGPIASRRKERLGRSDVTVILFRKLWERELRALASGGPLKQWTLTLDLEPTSGR